MGTAQAYEAGGGFFRLTKVKRVSLEAYVRQDFFSKRKSDSGYWIRGMTTGTGMPWIPCSDMQQYKTGFMAELINELLIAHQIHSVRRDAILALRITMGVSGKAWKTHLTAEGLPDLALQQHLRAALNFFALKFGGGKELRNLLAMAKYGYRNYCLWFFPVTVDGRLCARDIVGGPAELGRMQKEFHELSVLREH